MKIDHRIEYTLEHLRSLRDVEIPRFVAALKSGDDIISIERGIAEINDQLRKLLLMEISELKLERGGYCQ